MPALTVDVQVSYIQRLGKYVSCSPLPKLTPFPVTELRFTHTLSLCLSVSLCVSPTLFCFSLSTPTTLLLCHVACWLSNSVCADRRES